MEFVKKNIWLTIALCASGYAQTSAMGQKCVVLESSSIEVDPIEFLIQQTSAHPLMSQVDVRRAVEELVRKCAGQNERALKDAVLVAFVREDVRIRAEMEQARQAANRAHEMLLQHNYSQESSSEEIENALRYIIQQKNDEMAKIASERNMRLAGAVMTTIIEFSDTAISLISLIIKTPCDKYASLY